MRTSTAMALALATTVAWFGAGHALEPYEGTSRGNIAWQATEAYKHAIESCYPGTPDNALIGPRFVACLKQLIRDEAASLDNAYAVTTNFLKPYPDKRARGFGRRNVHG